MIVKPLTVILAASVICFSTVFFWFVNCQFSLKNICIEMPSHVDHLNLEERNNLEKMMNQTFAYLDRGRQSFVFISQDGRYVLKFFDSQKLQPSFWNSLFTNPKNASKKMRKLIEGYRVASLYNADHSALLYAQLSPNPDLKLIVEVNDRFGIHHSIDLSKMPFILQKKALPTRQAITHHLKRGETSEVKRLLYKIIDMYLDEYSRGLYDRDHNFMYNTGFIDGQPIRIDVGRLRIKEEMKQPEINRKDLSKIALKRTDEWLGRHFPAYRQEIVSDMNLKLQQIYSLGPPLKTSCSQ